MDKFKTKKRTVVSICVLLRIFRPLEVAAYTIKNEPMISKFNTIALFFFCLTMIGCTRQNDFRFKGEYPNWEYMSTYSPDEIIYINAKDSFPVAYRNRVFVTIDSSQTVFLNNHPVSNEDFESSFEYVYTNPNKLKHLPESPEQAVVLLAFMINANLISSLGEEKIHLESNHFKVLQSIISRLQKKYVVEELKIKPNEVSTAQQDSIERKFPLNIAVYSNAFEEYKKQMNRGNLSNFQGRNRKLVGRNVIEVLINDKQEVYLKGEILPVEKLTDTLKLMILNAAHNPNLPEDPKQAIVSFETERGVEYDQYLKVYNSLKQAYKELWEEEAQRSLGKFYDDLSAIEKREIRSKIPLLITEKERTFLDDK